MKKRKPNKIVKRLQKRLDNTILSLLQDVGLSIPGYDAYVVDQRRGFASCSRKFFTVPRFAYEKGIKYFTYYVAHELSHVLRYLQSSKRGKHDFEFYKIFMRVCPKELQHFELNYKPSSSKYGINNKLT